MKKDAKIKEITQYLATLADFCKKKGFLLKQLSLKMN